MVVHKEWPLKRSEDIGLKGSSWMHKFLIQREKKNIGHYIYDMFHHGLEYLFFFFWFPTMYLQNFQLETNHCLRRVDPSGENP